ncbi:hypothetical protein [Streptomyces sp. NPDC090036]|uniref:allene oxide cyclase barrel-like domain-containing protein n=1 Tax=Streptomyces sp. NPDC090036 TaxID=3365926 RepID=UPI00382E501E
MRPIRAACLGTATALVALLAWAPAVTADATDPPVAHAKPQKQRVITLTGKLAQQTRFPVNSGGPSQGDRTVVRSTLHDAAGNQVGETGGTCTTTRVAEGGAEACYVTYVLPGGQLSVQGMVFGIVPGPPGSFDNAITGGTGEFDRARGSVHVGPIVNGARTFTIYLK